jgi:hypothetical protein
MLRLLFLLRSALLLLAWCSCTVCFIFCLLILLCIIAMLLLLLLLPCTKVSCCCYWDAPSWHGYQPRHLPCYRHHTPQLLLLAAKLLLQLVLMQHA